MKKRKMKYGASVYCVYIEWKKTRVGLRDTVTISPKYISEKCHVV